MDEYFVPTRSCSESKTHEICEFTDIPKQGKQIKLDIKKGENVEEVEMKRARFEVYKFAQSGLPNPERQKSQFDLALKLGAVPRKNKVINYKKLKEEKQALKKKESEGMTLMEKNIKRKKRRKDPESKLRKKRKVGAGILKCYGKVKKR